MWCRAAGEELVITARTGRGAAEIARHRLSVPGSPRILDGHYPHHPGGNGPRQPRPKPRTEAEAAFLAIGDGTQRWLAEAAATVTRICRNDLVVVDDIGMLPAVQDAAEAFYRITDAAYERRSVAVTSNIHPSGFDSIMPRTLATATVDRLLHHAHLVLTKGDSHRLA